MIQFLKSLSERLSKNRRDGIYNLGYRLVNQKRVLVSYLTDSLTSSHVDFKYSSNRKECQIIITSFIDMGFIVDLVDCRENYIDHGISYDYIFGFGDAFRTASLRPSGKRILYRTEGAPCFSYFNEEKRCEYFYERHRKKVAIERSHTYYFESDLIKADIVLVLGEKHKLYVEEKYQKKAIDLYPVGIPSKHSKESFSPSKDILWFGSRGIIHKGLDLVLDAMAQLPEWRLHVCGVDKKDVTSLLPVSKNIVWHGKVDVDGHVFKNLINKCNFMYLLSCSEAVPTSVITVMKAGVIPVITANCGTDFTTAITLNELRVTDVLDHISSTYNLRESQIREGSIDVRREASLRFSERNFSLRLMHILETIIESKET